MTTRPGIEPTFADVDMLSDGRVADPFPFFAAARHDDPVHWSDRYRAWFLFRFDDVWESLRDPRFSSDRVRPIYETKLNDEQRRDRRPTFDILQHWMVFNDPPQHTRLRRLVSHAFTPRAVERLRPRIEALVDALIDGLLPQGRADLIRDFAYPIPAVIIAEMLGAPPEDRYRFKEWSDDIMTLVFGAEGVLGRRERAQDGLSQLADYLSSLVHRFRSDPADNLITALVHAKENDDSLTDEEIVSTCTLLLFGGHETTTNLIGNGTLTLLRHPEQLAELIGDPTLLSSAVEELLRFDGPSKMEVRRAAADIELRDRTIHEGDQVYLVQSSANRDDLEFPEPDRLDLRRQPNRHLGFGFGLHYCLGASIARLEASVAIDRVIRRLPRLSPAAEPEHWHPTLISRGMSSFPVEFG
ncbi:MAG: cytochrome P450 [Acidimicrobiales bacterium]